MIGLPSKPVPTLSASTAPGESKRATAVGQHVTCSTMHFGKVWRLPGCAARKRQWCLTAAAPTGAGDGLEGGRTGCPGAQAVACQLVHFVGDPVENHADVSVGACWLQTFQVVSGCGTYRLAHRELKLNSQTLPGSEQLRDQLTMPIWKSCDASAPRTIRGPPESPLHALAAGEAPPAK